MFLTNPGVGPEKINVDFKHGSIGPKLFPKIQLDEAPHHPVNLFNF